jgi:outer membrane protein
MKNATQQLQKLALIASLAVLPAAIAQADTIFGVYAGVGSWESDYDGKAGDPSVTLKELGVEKSSNTFFYLAIEHPVPIIPNLRVSVVDIASEQTATITRTFTIDDTNFNASEKVNSEFDLSHTDATLYYEILDNWLNLDLGVTVRKFGGFVEASTQTQAKSVSVDIDQALPMLYVKGQFDLPFSGLSAGVEGNYISYQDSKLTDFSAKVSYLFDSAFDIGLEAGYRSMSLTVDEDDLTANLDLKGPYAALIAHF